VLFELSFILLSSRGAAVAVLEVLSVVDGAAIVLSEPLSADSP